MTFSSAIPEPTLFDASEGAGALEWHTSFLEARDHLRYRVYTVTSPLLASGTALETRVLYTNAHGESLSANRTTLIR